MNAFCTLLSRASCYPQWLCVTDVVYCIVVCFFCFFLMVQFDDTSLQTTEKQRKGKSFRSSPDCFQLTSLVIYRLQPGSTGPGCVVRDIILMKHPVLTSTVHVQKRACGWLRICIFRHVSGVSFLVLAIFVSEELSNVLALYRHEAQQQVFQ